MPLCVVVATLTSVLIWRSRASVDASPTVLPSPALPLRLIAAGHEQQALEQRGLAGPVGTDQCDITDRGSCGHRIPPDGLDMAVSRWRPPCRRAMDDLCWVHVGSGGRPKATRKSPNCHEPPARAEVAPGPVRDPHPRRRSRIARGGLQRCGAASMAPRDGQQLRRELIGPRAEADVSDDPECRLGWPVRGGLQNPILEALLTSFVRPVICRDHGLALLGEDAHGTSDDMSASVTM